MEIALLTGQRREDIANMRFADAKETERRLQVVQSKTGARLRLDLGLGLDVLGMTIGDAVKRCRDDVVSRYLVHLPRTIGKAKAGDCVRGKTLGYMFSEARRRAVEAGALTVGANPPTFHEQRSLSARLYLEQGASPGMVQALMGHKNAAMTEVYQDVRGSEWIEVAKK